MRKSPTAPPVYRPQPVPKVLQRKAAGELRNLPSAQSNHTPVAPPVYRPQPAPKCLQAKTAGGVPVGNTAGGAVPRTAAPPVYRPRQNDAPGPRQTLPIAPRLPAPPIARPAQPAVHRPPVKAVGQPFPQTTQARVAQPKAMAGAAPTRLPLHTRPAAPTRNAPTHHPATQGVRGFRGGTIQRLVILVSQDEMAVSNYKKLIENPRGLIDSTGSLRAGDPKEPGLPLHQLGLNETLHVVSHGDGRGRIEGQNARGDVSMMNAEEFLSMLIAAGFDQQSHRGAIRLISCFSGSRTPGGEVFAENLVRALRAQDFCNPVIGFDGLVRVREDARIDVAPPDKVEEFNTLSAALRGVNKRQFSALRPPDINPKSPANIKWRENLQKLRAEGNELAEQIDALFKPQNVAKNIHYTRSVAPRPNRRPLPNPWASPQALDPDLQAKALEIEAERRRMAYGGSCKIEALRFDRRDNDRDPPSAFA